MTRASLNRTFYGIETDFFLGTAAPVSCLNRTFYGIETLQRRAPSCNEEQS